MSYKCDECNALRVGSELKIIKDVREVNYKNLIEKPSRNPNEEKTYFLKGESIGWEIESEIKVCESCYNILKDNNPVTIPNKKEVKCILSKKDTNIIKRNFKSNNSNDYESRSTVEHKRSGSFKSFDKAFNKGE